MSEPRGAETTGETTGRYLVLLEDDAVAAGVQELSNVAGIRIASTADAAGASVHEQLSAAGGLVFHELGVAVVVRGPEPAGRAEQRRRRDRARARSSNRNASCTRFAADAPEDEVRPPSTRPC